MCLNSIGFYWMRTILRKWQEKKYKFKQKILEKMRIKNFHIDDRVSIYLFMYLYMYVKWYWMLFLQWIEQLEQCISSSFVFWNRKFLKNSKIDKKMGKKDRSLLKTFILTTLLQQLVFIYIYMYVYANDRKHKPNINHKPST